nr:NAD(P)H-dependent oxidoreductase [Chlorobium sp. KB01]
MGENSISAKTRESEKFNSIQNNELIFLAGLFFRVGRSREASRPYGQSAWSGKPAGIIGISPGAAGTAMAQQHLRNILAFLDVPVLAQPEAFIQHKEGLFDAGGNIIESSRQFLQSWMERYVAWVKLHRTKP